MVGSIAQSTDDNFDYRSLVATVIYMFLQFTNIGKLYIQDYTTTSRARSRARWLCGNHNIPGIHMNLSIERRCMLLLSSNGHYHCWCESLPKCGLTRYRSNHLSFSDHNSPTRRQMPGKPIQKTKTMTWTMQGFGRQYHGKEITTQLVRYRRWDQLIEYEISVTAVEKLSRSWTI